MNENPRYDVKVVALVHHCVTFENRRGPYLIIAPLSTLSHWQREFERWTNLTVCLYWDSEGGRETRDKIRQYEWYYPSLKELGVRFNERALKFQVLITSYETLVTDIDAFLPLPWEMMVIDEGHRLKSTTSKLATELARLRSNLRFLLTGTPIQNNITELFNLLSFVQPTRFHLSARSAFLSRYGDMRSAEELEALQREIAPFILRRVKEEVEKSIPRKEQTVIDVELTTLQKQYYRAIFEKNREFLYKGCAKNNTSLINIEMELRKCCNHPYLIKGVEDAEYRRLEREAAERMKKEAQIQREKMEQEAKERQQKQQQQQQQQEQQQRQGNRFNGEGNECSNRDSRAALTALSDEELLAKVGEDVMQSCRLVLQQVAAHDSAYPFLRPVDADSAPHYYEIIKKPMDLRTCWNKLQRSGGKGNGAGKVRDGTGYENRPSAFAADMRLIFTNCMAYNAKGSDIYDAAEELMGLFESLYATYVTQPLELQERLEKLRQAAEEERRGRKAGGGGGGGGGGEDEDEDYAMDGDEEEDDDFYEDGGRRRRRRGGGRRGGGGGRSRGKEKMARSLISAPPVDIWNNTPCLGLHRAEGLVRQGSRGKRSVKVVYWVHASLSSLLSPSSSSSSSSSPSRDSNGGEGGEEEKDDDEEGAGEAESIRLQNSKDVSVFLSQLGELSEKEEGEETSPLQNVLCALKKQCTKPDNNNNKKKKKKDEEEDGDDASTLLSLSLSDFSFDPCEARHAHAVDDSVLEKYKLKDAYRLASSRLRSAREAAVAAAASSSSSSSRKRRRTERGGRRKDDDEDEEESVDLDLAGSGNSTVHALGSLLSLGNEELQTTFHNKKYIYAPGYRSTRLFPAVGDPSRRVVYTSEILIKEEEEEESKEEEERKIGHARSPLFRVSVGQVGGEGAQRHAVFDSHSSSACWVAVIRAVNEERKRRGMSTKVRRRKKLISFIYFFTFF